MLYTQRGFPRNDVCVQTSTCLFWVHVILSQHNKMRLSDQILSSRISQPSSSASLVEKFDKLYVHDHKKRRIWRGLCQIKYNRALYVISVHYHRSTSNHLLALIIIQYRNQHLRHPTTAQPPTDPNFDEVFQSESMPVAVRASRFEGRNPSRGVQTAGGNLRSVTWIFEIQPKCRTPKLKN